MEGKKKKKEEEERIMPNLVATTSALARTTYSERTTFAPKHRYKKRLRKSELVTEVMKPMQ